MPIYMDLHIGQGLTAEGVARDHQADLKIQDRFGCKCLTYWVDTDRGNAYCLVEAPTKTAVYELHRNSHKKLPDEIIEVDPRVIKAFLGRVHDPEVVDYMIDQKIKVFNDPAFRAILLISSRDQLDLAREYGEAEAQNLLREFHNVIRNSIKRHNGVAAEKEGVDVVATFTSGMQAVLCSVMIIDFTQSVKSKLGVGIGIHAGHPVDKSQNFFGTTLKLLRLFSNVIPKDEILVSATVKNLVKSSGSRSLVESETGKLHYLSQADEDFLKDLVEVLYENWKNPDFEMEDCCNAMSMSKSQLYRRCVETSALSPNRLLREFRLVHARNLLLSSTNNVAETAFESGFNSPSYFTKCFQKKFGLKPNAYIDQRV